MKQTMLGLKTMLLCILCFLLLFSCKKETTTVVQQTTTTSNDGNSAETLISGMGGLSGALMMSGGGSGASVAAADADIKFSGHPEYDTKADSSGNVSILNILPGTYTIYADATLPAVLAGVHNDLSREDLPRMAQFKDIVISSTEATTLPETLLTEPGSISGTISLINNPSNVTLDGIMAFIPGTSYIAMTDDNGDFSMTGVPAGTYDYLRFSKDGLTTSDIYDVGVTSGEDTVLDEVRMSLSTGPSGAIVSIEDADTAVSGISYPVLSQGTGETIVTVNLRYDTRAVLMKVAHESSFLNVGWVPVANSYTFTEVNNPDAVDHFETDGTKYVYVKFADLNGLESSVYYQRFIIDNDAPTIDEDNTTLLFDWGNVGTTGFHHVPIELSASDSGTGIKQVMLCNNSSFTSCSWQTYPLVIPEGEDYFEWDLGTNYSSGTKTIYIKVKDYLDRISSVISKEIIAGDYTPIISSIDDSVTLKSQWGPYTFDSNISFTGNLNIEHGVTIYFHGGYTITVEGLLTINGTSSSYVELRKQAAGQNFGGFILNTGRGGPHFINYLKMESAQIEEATNPQFRINGGTIQNSIIHGYSSFLAKTGTQTLLISHNTLTGYGFSGTTIATNENEMDQGAFISLQGGANTTISHNTIAIASRPNAIAMRPNHYAATDIFSTSSIFSSAIIKYNTISYTETTLASIRVFAPFAGTLNIYNNNVSINKTLDPEVQMDGNVAYAHIVYIKGPYTANAYHNNFSITANNFDGAKMRHFHLVDSSGSPTLTSGNDTSTLYNYTGGALNANHCGGDDANLRHSCSNDAGLKFCGDSLTIGCRSSAFSTTAGQSNCVGSLCNGDEG